MKEITIDGVEYTLTPKQQEFTYPMWFKNKYTGLVIKFTSIDEGIAVIADKYNKITGKKAKWRAHTNTDVWEQVEDPNKLHDKDAIWCWDSSDITVRRLKFWDAYNNTTFDFEGDRGGAPYDNYEKIFPENEPDWVKKARKLLED